MEGTKEAIIEMIAEELSDEFGVEIGDVYADLMPYTLAKLASMNSLELSHAFVTFSRFVEEDDRLVEVDANEDGTTHRYAEDVADDMADYLFELLRK